MGSCFKLSKKKTWNWLHTASPAYSKSPDASRSQNDLKRHYSLFKADIYTFTYSWSFWTLGLHPTSCMEPVHVHVFSCVFFFYQVFKHVLMLLSCLGECCDIVLLWSSMDVLCTIKFHLTFHLHGDGQIMRIYILGWNHPLRCNIDFYLSWQQYTNKELNVSHFSQCKKSMLREKMWIRMI